MHSTVCRRYAYFYLIRGSKQSAPGSAHGYYARRSHHCCVRVWGACLGWPARVPLLFFSASRSLKYPLFRICFSRTTCISQPILPFCYPFFSAEEYATLCTPTHTYTPYVRVRPKAFPLQHIGEIVLRSALPRIRRLLHRQSRMVVDGGPLTAAPAMRACASVMIAALRLSTSPSGKPIENSLLQNPTSVDFLGVKKSALSSGSSGNDAGAEGSAGKEEEEDLDATLPPKDLAEEWLRAPLGGILEGERGGDALLVETAAWATLRVLQTLAMGPLRVSVAPRVAEAFLRVLVAGKVCVPPWRCGRKRVAAWLRKGVRLTEDSSGLA